MNGLAKQETIPVEALHILVADDRPDVLEALRLLLKDAGHKTETVTTPHMLQYRCAPMLPKSLSKAFISA